MAADKNMSEQRYAIITLKFPFLSLLVVLNVRYLHPGKHAKKIMEQKIFSWCSNLHYNVILVNNNLIQNGKKCFNSNTVSSFSVWKNCSCRDEPWLKKNNWPNEARKLANVWGFSSQMLVLNLNLSDEIYALIKF